ncbi:TonB-dependent receptor [Sphingobium aquiterrae]|uniref:TonB-dependent receptor n=1 Tax=Sphingobium aquiterrae TaxID=2038656 RepID=UPI003018E291
MRKLTHILLAGTAMLGFAGQALAQGSEGGTPAGDATEGEIVVTGSRLSKTLESFPGSSTVLGEKQLEEQLATTNDIGSVLAFTVPGLAASNGTAANVEQGLRGRPLRVFVDGVPVSNPLRDGGRDLRLISPNAIQGVEVIRGASAIYGQGGAGGIINYVTRKGTASDGWKFRTELGTGFSTEHFGDSLNPSIAQTITGAAGGFDITLNGSYERVNGQFDADGDRLAPDPHNYGGIADSDIVNLFGKVGYNFGGQRIEAMVNYYRQHQDTDYISVTGNIANGIKETATKGSYDARALDPVNRNLMSYVGYYNDDLLASIFHLQVYYLKNYSVFSFDPARLGGTQTTITSEKYGVQADFRTSLEKFGLPKGELLWGTDISRDTTAQPLIPLTNAPGDGRTFTPPLKQMNYAIFAQLELPVTDWFTLRAGVRHDEFRLTIDDFVAGLTGVHVSGGKLDYAATPVNIGGTIQVMPEVQVFGGFSQGFSIPDIGAPLRRVSVTNLDDFDPKPQLVNNFELGVRGTAYGIHYAAAYFISKSKYGTDFVIDTANPTEAKTLREKERIQGWEVSLDGKIGVATRWSASYAHTEGRRDADHDGTLDTPLSGRRIGPDQLNMAIEHDLTTDWLVRLQYNHSGSRNKFPTATVGSYFTGRVRPVDRIDASTRFKVDAFDVSLGVNNLLNEDYYSVTSQMLNRNELYSKAQGRTVYIKLGLNY